MMGGTSVLEGLSSEDGLGMGAGKEGMGPRPWGWQLGSKCQGACTDGDILACPIPWAHEVNRSVAS